MCLLCVASLAVLNGCGQDVVIGEVGASGVQPGANAGAASVAGDNVGMGSGGVADDMDDVQDEQETDDGLDDETDAGAE